MQVNEMTEEFGHIGIFGKPVLFTNAPVICITKGGLTLG